MAMAWRLPTLLATPGNLHHHDSETLSLATDHLLPLSSSSTSTAIIRTNTWRFMKCTASAGAGAVNLARRTPVRPPSILVVGAAEALGRQIVRRALDEGHDVTCLVRPRPTPDDFLRDWRATIVNIGKEKLLLHNEVILFVFYSIHNCDKHPEVPLMEIKYCTENIAVPILEEKSVWGTDAPTRIAYMDTQFNHALTDVAPLTFIGLRNEKVSGKLLTFAGPRAWTTQEVITLCEMFAGQEANITRVSVSVLRCTNDVADRLAFLETGVLTSETNKHIILFSKRGDINIINSSNRISSTRRRSPNHLHLSIS
ncbi:hypothetical protein D8674_003552 [Pyrus ussuriensis x Pyrus communis]|uniref:NAD(P)-binding domain-containing protein n=1 Tax=Pyrus ussuriensis x Pyrus communis TaxID=2448454 RepID=A0A5N5FI04_9ROSA|nr:hypothetical protein D8674_003552 [Pyrus ussuriensis x Pyrus communis]